MKLSIKYSKLSATHDFLYTLKLGGIKTVHRTRLCNLLAKAIQEVAKEEQELIRSFAKIDESGEPMKHKNGGYIIGNVEAFKVEQTKFLDEEFIIDGENHKKMLLSMKSIVESYEEEVSGPEGEVFAILYEQLVESE